MELFHVLCIGTLLCGLMVVGCMALFIWTVRTASTTDGGEAAIPAIAAIVFAVGMFVCGTSAVNQHNAANNIKIEKPK